MFKAQNVSGDISQFLAIEHQVWHRRMRGLQSHGKGYGRHSWDIRDCFKAWRRGIGRVNLPLVDGVFVVPARGDAGVQHFPLCGKHDPPQDVGVSPIGASASGSASVL